MRLELKQLAYGYRSKVAAAVVVVLKHAESQVHGGRSR